MNSTWNEMLIANASVSAHCPGTFEPRRVRSAADGTFLFETLAPGQVACTAEHAGVSIAKAFEAQPDRETYWNAVLGDGDGSEHVAILLVDTAGTPLVGWNVRLAWAGGRTVNVRTGADGNADLPCLDPAPADAFVHAPDTALSAFAYARFPGLSPSRERVRLVVDTNARRSALTGRAVSEKLIEGRATVELWHHEFREFVSATADADGRFRIDRVPPGTLDVQISLPGHAAWSRQGVAVLAGETTDLGELTLRAAGALSGTVVGPDGQPPAALVVSVITKEQRLVGTYSGGVYRVDDVPAGKHRLQVQGPGVAGASFEVEVRPGVEVERKIVLDVGVERRIQIDVPEEARGFVSLLLRRKNEPMSWYAGQVVAAARTAEFLACMAPGDYEVVARGTNGYEAKGVVRFTPGDDSPVQFPMLRR
ncbi:MAG: carboxypeptidase regulatory-like domain-containing protein [Planctomycetes bacterium]|nr:carboxypeptidase regulatory-like domain-containing protein [Planctomycetota bacterium]